MRSDPRQMVLDLFPEERSKEKSPLEACVSWLIEVCGCDESRIRPLVAQCYESFGRAEASDPAYYRKKRAAEKRGGCSHEQ